MSLQKKADVCVYKECLDTPPCTLNPRSLHLKHSCRCLRSCLERPLHTPAVADGSFGADRPDRPSGQTVRTDNRAGAAPRTGRSVLPRGWGGVRGAPHTSQHQLAGGNLQQWPEKQNNIGCYFCPTLAVLKAYAYPSVKANKDWTHRVAPEKSGPHLL